MNNNNIAPVQVIGGGLAGSEASWQLAQAGVPVLLCEMRPHRATEVHQTDALAELVCSNSFRSDDAQNNAVGLLHEEMRRLDSLIMACADQHKVPAGGALAVDRDGFADAVTQKINTHPLITLRREEITTLPTPDSVIIATGPLTSEAMSNIIAELTGTDDLSFFDAIAPIVHKDSIDLSKAWFQSRYDKGDGADYINCALDKDQYNRFIAELLAGEKADLHDWEGTPWFEGCLPIEVMAERGAETLRFGPMKPVGLQNPASETPHYAVVQLRQDNKLGTLYNIVGFQTKLKHGEQLRIFRTIPGLEQAKFARLGGIHRNTFINSPQLLDHSLRLKKAPRFRFAGQITGVEGYVESAASGLLAGRSATAERLGRGTLPPPPPHTAHGALLNHVTEGHIGAKTFQPMNINFGLFPPLVHQKGQKKLKKKDRKTVKAMQALDALAEWQTAFF